MFKSRGYSVSLGLIPSVSSRNAVRDLVIELKISLRFAHRDDIANHFVDFTLCVNYNHCMNNLQTELIGIWKPIKNKLSKRLEDFHNVWETYPEDELFGELAFCILTPQSSAKMCWRAIENLKNKKLLLCGKKEKIEKELFGVRFKYTKAQRIIEARDKIKENKKLSIRNILNKHPNCQLKREWLVNNIKGIGYKEAGHFLRNIGFAQDLAILDRHILKNLKYFGAITEIPKTLTKTKYFEIENQMKKFAKKTGIPLDHMDLLFWQKETGEIFK